VEYLVTMTTHVPDGTSDAAVEDRRAREAAHSRDLAAQGHLLRLWRPPLLPGEWRTLGLFEAADRAALEAVLLSMPLRVWRTDEVAALAPHRNDPGPRAGRVPAWDTQPGSSEFFTTFTVTVPPGTPGGIVDATEAREADTTRELARQGKLRRLWVLSGEGRALGLWRASDGGEMQTILDSLPLRDWFDVETIRLAPHPSDPGADPH
jgi:muconolactone delta-isomerase